MGEALARERRGDVPARDLARGPARLTVALDIDRRSRPRPDRRRRPR